MLLPGFLLDPFKYHVPNKTISLLTDAKIIFPESPPIANSELLYLSVSVENTKLNFGIYCKLQTVFCNCTTAT